VSENGTVLANCHFIQHTMIFAREKMPMFSDKTIDIPHESSGSWNFTCIPNLDILYIHGKWNNVLISCVLHCFFMFFRQKIGRCPGPGGGWESLCQSPAADNVFYMGIFSRCVPFRRIIWFIDFFFLIFLLFLLCVLSILTIFLLVINIIIAIYYDNCM
jgi:hypothetical protein